MASSEPPRLFSIRRLPPQEPPSRTAREESAEPELPPEAAPAPETEPLESPELPEPPEITAEDAPPSTGGLFAGPGQVLAFLGAVAGARLAHEAGCRQGPDGRWFSEVPVSWRRAAPYVHAAGGQPLAGEGASWVPVALTGDRLLAGPREDVGAWPSVDLADLLARVPLTARAQVQASSLVAVVPGPLGRWALRRALSLGVEVWVSSARRRSLGGEDGDSTVLLLRLQSSREPTIPWSLAQSLSNLPYSGVGRPAGGEGDRLLVDVRYRLPLAESLLGALVPEGEIWMLGGPDLGHWRLERSGEEVAGAELLSPPQGAITETVATAAAELPAPIPVRLAPVWGQRASTEALLLDDTELGWLRHFLMTRPVGERCFLLPGGERHLIVAPGGLGGTLPFGTPLTRVGPGALYLEAGFDFFPPLPAGARQRVFAPDDASVVVVVSSGAFRFARDSMLPAWSLWVGDGPQVTQTLDLRSADLLARIGLAYRRAVPEPEGPGPVKRGAQEVNRQELFQQAWEAEQAGDLLRAAQLLESAGDHGAAGRLYERAAASHRR